MNTYTEDQISKIETFARKRLDSSDVYIFDIILCDNDIDKEGDCFSDKALQEMKESFVGVAGYLEQNSSHNSHVARVFDTEIVQKEDRKTADGRPYKQLKACAYMAKTKQNESLIHELECGIEKVVSISCVTSRRICSICGQNRMANNCGHIIGRRYAGVTCHCTIDHVSDVYEWSMVASVMKDSAGMIKKTGCVVNVEVENAIMALEETSRTLDLLTEDLRKQVIRLCFSEGESACARALAQSTIHLNAKELLALRKSLELGQRKLIT